MARHAPGVPLPPGNDRPFCCRTAQARKIRATITDVAHGRLTPGRARYREYRRNRYLGYLIRTVANG